MRHKAENMIENENDLEILAKRRVPIMLTYISPFRIVNAPDSLPWNIEIRQINHGTWDYVELHRLVGGLDVGLSKPYHMVIARDGAVGLPVLPEFRDIQASVEFLNRCFAALLLGGVYCESIGADGLDFGSIIDWTYLRSHSNAPAYANQFHTSIRYRQAAPLNAISLLKPRIIDFQIMKTAMEFGRKLLDEVPELSPEFLLKGVTGFTRRDWGAALLNLWIIIEQITSHLWEKKVMIPARSNTVSVGRVDQLSDTRTWTVAARHELLYQIQVISADTLIKLSVARRARNALAHTGKHPTERDANSAYSSVLALLEKITANNVIPLALLDIADHTLSDPFMRSEPTKLEPSHYMEIPKLPGETDIEKLEADVSRSASGVNDSPKST